MKLIDYETTLEDGGEPPAPAEPEPAEPEVAAEAEAEPEWTAPSQQEWQQTQQKLEELSEIRDLLIQSQQAGQYQQPEPQPQEPPLPEYDLFDPVSANAYFDAREQRQLAAMQQMLAPILEKQQEEQASQWADQTLNQLGVPDEEDGLWRDLSLFTSAGFQQFDQYGRPMVHPAQATKNAYDVVQKFADKIRRETLEQAKQQQQQEQTALQNRINVPMVPSGPGGAEGLPENADEFAVARMWAERDSASAE